MSVAKIICLLNFSNYGNDLQYLPYCALLSLFLVLFLKPPATALKYELSAIEVSVITVAVIIGEKELLQNTSVKSHLQRRETMAFKLSVVLVLVVWVPMIHWSVSARNRRILLC